jgi:hypothetical protein
VNVLAGAGRARDFLRKLGFGEFTSQVMKRLDLPPECADPGPTDGAAPGGRAAPESP